MDRSAQNIKAQPTIKLKTETFHSYPSRLEARSRLRLDSLLLSSSSMDSSSSSVSSNFLSYWVYFNFILFRPVLAILFVLSFITLWWFLAWKLVLVHVPLVQEIFGLRKKKVKPKPPTRRLSRYYNSITAHDSTSH